MFSSTTIALSTSMPTAKAIPARLTTFKFLPKAFMKINVPIMLIGMAVAAIPVDATLLRNITNTDIASNPPIKIFLCTSPIAPLI